MPNLDRIKQTPIGSKISLKKKEISVYTKALLNSHSFKEKKFFIFAQGRTGSQLLCHLLNSHPSIFCDLEILYHPVWFPQLYIESKCLIAPQPIYGFKMKIYQLTQQQKIETPQKILENLYADNWKIIYLKRENVFRQALSNLVAIQRNIWHKSKRNSKTQKDKISVDCDRLFKMMNARKDFLEEEQKIIANIPHLSINYESDLLDTRKHQITCDKIFEFLDVSSIKVNSNIDKTTSKNLSDFIQNYDEVYARFAKTEYAELVK